MNKYFFIFPLCRNRKCKTKLRQSKQTISDDDVFNNEDLDDILFRHQDDEVLDVEDRPLKPPKKAKRKPRSKPAPGYGPAPDRKVYNCKYCEYNGKKLEWLAHLKSAHSDKNLVCKLILCNLAKVFAGMVQSTENWVGKTVFQVLPSSLPIPNPLFATCNCPVSLILET